MPSAGLVPGLPGTSAYCASKHAAEAFTSALRMEMKAWGIKVRLKVFMYDVYRLID